jgi:hypothetical protein
MFDNLLILEVKPSLRLGLILTGLHLLTLWTLWLPLQLPPWLEWSVLQITGTILIFLSYYHSMRYHVYLFNHPLQGCVLYNDNVWLADERVAAIDSESYQHPWGVVVRARLSIWRVYSLVILADALDENRLRQLRVRLKHRFR